MLPIIVLIVVGGWALAYFWVVNGFVSARVTTVRAETTAIGASYGSALASSLNARLALVEGLTAYMTVKVLEPQIEFPTDMAHEFPAFAGIVFHSAEGVRNISVSPDFKVGYVFPDDPGNRKVIGNNILEDKRVGFAAAVRRAIDTHGVTVHEPVDLIQGGLGLIARQAVYRDDRPWGAVGMAFLVEPLVREAGLPGVSGRLNWGLRTAAGTPVAGDASVFARDPVVTRVSLPDGYWELALVPDGNWEKGIRSGAEYHLIQAAMVALGIVALLLAVTQSSNRFRLREEVRARTADLWETQKQLESHSRELGQAHEELERFAYVAAHDLQEPLRSITSFSQLILRTYNDKLDDEGRAWLSQVVDGGHRMRQLLRDIQLYLAEATLPLPSAPHSVADALEEAEGKLANAISISGAVIHAEELPMVMADRRRLTEIMTVLLSNAIEYRKPGVQPEVRISSRREGGMQVVSVTDNGIGIAPEYHKRVFEVFQRLHGRHEHPGTGMGLAIVSKMVMRLQGKVILNSEPGQGSTFSIYLPGV
jgi:signal transduction histidine kinase